MVSDANFVDAKRDVAADRGGKEKRFLRHDAHRAPEVRRRQRPDIAPVDDDRAGG